MSVALDRELADVLTKLDSHARGQVLEFARSLQDHDDLPRPDLSKFCGVISKEDAQLMREAIEEAFERV